MVSLLKIRTRDLRLSIMYYHIFKIAFTYKFSPQRNVSSSNNYCRVVAAGAATLSLAFLVFCLMSPVSFALMLNGGVLNY